MINKTKTIGLRTTLSAALLLTASCSSGFKRPESIEEKMTRFTSRHKNPNRVPKISVLPVKISLSKGTRAPASAQQEQKITSKPIISNKRLYFLGLYTQYKSLGRFITAEETPELKHCPAFHSSLLNLKEEMACNPSSKLSVNFSGRYQALTPDAISLYPELALPTTLNNEETTLYSAIKSSQSPDKDTHELLSQAIKVHLTKTYKELEELCDSGTSHNYYNYENLTTYAEQNSGQFGANSQSLKILFKTTLFSNKAILESLSYGKGIIRGRVPASAHDNKNSAYDGVVGKMGTKWTTGYFQALRKVRK